MIDTAQLRAALDRLENEIALHQALDEAGEGFWKWLNDQSVICAAARILLTIREAGALIITPDEDGEWPEWTTEAIELEVFAGWLRGIYGSGPFNPRQIVELRNLLLDALRDAMPDGET